MPYGRILVPLDGSEVAETSIPYAALIPSRSARLLSVEPVTLSAARKRVDLGEESPWGPWVVTTTAGYLTHLGMWFRDKGRDVEVVVTRGDPKRRIVEAAADVDLIVMTTRGQGVTKALLGSTAEYVARHAPVPTLLVRDEHPAMTPAILRIVVPLDGSAYGEDALPVAATMRDTLGVGLHLIRVVDAATTLDTVSDLEREAEAYLERQRERADIAGGATHEVGVIHAGTVVERLLTALRPGDLVVMATRGRGGPVRMLGSVAAAMMRQSPVPVVLVRSSPGEASTALSGAMAEIGDGDAKQPG